ncbi:hypothetical protein ACSLO9_33730, partial [Escherichia coli]
AFAWFYLGAFLVAVIAWFLLGNAQKMPQTTLQWGELDLVMTSDILPRSGLHYSPMFDYEVRLVLAPD